MRVLGARFHAFPIRPGWESRVTVNPQTGCIEWCGATYPASTGARYAVVRMKHLNRNYYLHRLLMLGEGGYTDASVHICHACNNSICVNTDHLYRGNPKTNYADQVAIGRAVRFQQFIGKPGAQNHRAKLKPEQVLEIRRLSATGETRRALSRKFGVHPSTIYLIVKGKKWQTVS